MNLRNVTIGTTGVMMILTLLIPACIMACAGFAGVVEHVIVFPLFMWLFSGTPLLVSFILAIKLKYKISTVILLTSIMAYGIWFAYWSVGVGILLSDGYGTAPFMFFVIGPLSLPVMIPVWILALILNWRYAKKSIAPPQSNENEVQ